MRILLVDDDAQLLDTGRDILEDAGYEVVTAETVASAIAALRAQPPALMVVDFNLPDGSGVSLAAEARKIIPALRIILMTGEAEVNVPPGAVDNTLLKPVDPSRLLALLSKTLSTGRA